MKKFYLLLVLPMLVVMSSCNSKDSKENGVIWDVAYPSAGFVLFDDNGNNILKENSDAIYDFEVERNGEIYRYEEATRDLQQEAFGIYLHSRYPYMLCVGEFDQNESGSFVLRYRDAEWLVEYDYQLGYKNGRPYTEEQIKIDGRVVELSAVDQWELYGDGNVVDVYARSLDYTPSQTVYDIKYPSETFVIVDFTGSNLFETYPEMKSDVEIEYNGQTYNYNEAITREAAKQPLELYTPAVYPHCIEFGDFDYDDKGSYVIKYDEQSWLVDFEYDLRWENCAPVLTKSIEINGTPVDPIKIAEVEGGDGMVDIYALPLMFELPIYDISYPTATYVVLDNEGNNIFKSEPESIYEFEIEYNGVIYNYHDQTRELPQMPLALTNNSMYPYCLTFGDFDHNEKGSYTIRFRDREWLAEFEYSLEWDMFSPIISRSLKIDGEAVNPEIIEVLNEEINVYAIALR